MTKRFYKLHLHVLRDTKDVISSNILAVILARYNGNNKPLLQQTYIAKELYLTRQTVKKHIDALEKQGYIKTTPSKYGNIPSTQFEILPKLKRLIIEEEQQAQTPIQRTPHPQATTPTQQTPQPQTIEQENEVVDFFEFFQIPSEYKDLNTAAL